MRGSASGRRVLGRLGESLMIVVDARYCKGCGICVHFCPKNVLEISQEINAYGYYVPCVVAEEKCSKCNQCELYCPDFAIFLLEEE
jgi:2-oxoglutarate ferredoxin oxidoreductase subunit delta